MTDLRELAKKALNASPNYDAAVEELLSDVDHGSPLEDELVRLGAKQIIRTVAHEQRDDIRDAILAGPMTEAQKANLHAVQAGTKAPAPSKVAGISGLKMLSNTFLYGGKVRLRDARKDDLLEAIEQHEKQGAGHLRQAAFLKSVANKLNKSQRVRDVLTEDRLIKIQETLEKKFAA